MRNDKDNLIVKLTFEFALEIISFSEEIRKTNRFEMASQIFRSGTSIGANIREAQNAESKADFIHKLSIALKEANETEYWLDLLYETKYLSQIEFENIKPNIIELLKLLTSIINTSKTK